MENGVVIKSQHFRILVTAIHDGRNLAGMTQAAARTRTLGITRFSG